MQVPVHTETLDVTDTAKVEEFVTALPAEFKEVCSSLADATPHIKTSHIIGAAVGLLCLLQVDILVNNAGLALGKAPVHENNVEVCTYATCTSRLDQSLTCRCMHSVMTH